MLPESGEPAARLPDFLWHQASNSATLDCAIVAMTA